MTCCRVLQVKLLKCLVDNIVVDISFNQMGGLVTLNFLEEINSLIGNRNIFKRSIILVSWSAGQPPDFCFSRSAVVSLELQQQQQQLVIVSERVTAKEHQNHIDRRAARGQV